MSLPPLLPLLLLALAGPALAYRKLLADFDDDVQQIVSAMSVKAKIGQMAQQTVSAYLSLENGTTFVLNEDAYAKQLDDFFTGSVLWSPEVPPSIDNIREIISRLQAISLKHGSKLPTIFGIDYVHGAHFIKNATIFPQQINIGATFNVTHSLRLGEITARNSRATGVGWTFAPMADLMVQPSWSRTYEQFGEDPLLISEMVSAAVRGLQGSPKNLADRENHIAACVKHFIGYGDPYSGHDVDSAWVDEKRLMQYYVPPFDAAIKAGVATVMESFNDVNGVPVVSSRQYLQTLLRDTLDFDGMLVTDWTEIVNMHTAHRAANSTKEAIRIAMSETSIDMSMTPWDNGFVDQMVELVNEKKVSMDRIDVSAARIVQLKKDLGLLSDSQPVATTSNAYTSFGSVDDERESLDAARESIVLTKNENVLPLPLGLGFRLLMVGPGCDSRGLMSGGWTVHHQGTVDSAFWSGSTLVDAMMKSAPNMNITYIPTYKFVRAAEPYGYTGKVALINEDVEQALAIANDTDAIVVCAGEDHYTEIWGLEFDISINSELQTLTKMLAAANKPMVLVLFEGRPRVLGDMADLFDGAIVGMLPGPHGGQAVADVLLGLVNPSGRMPFSYPKYPSTNMPYWHLFIEQMHNEYQPLWAFGHGLSYTQFEYSNLRLSASEMSENVPEITVSVTVKNTGALGGSHSVLLFVTDSYRVISPEVRMLKGFKKIYLSKGASQDVEFTLSLESLSFYVSASEKRWQNGEFVAHLSPSTPADPASDVLSMKFYLKLNEEQPNAAADAPRIGTDPCKCKPPAKPLRTRLTDFDQDVQKIVNEMSLEQRIGQMSQRDTGVWFGYTTPDVGANKSAAVWFDDAKFGETLDQDFLGSVLNGPALRYEPNALHGSVISLESWRDVLTRMQKVAEKHGSKLPLLYGMDLVHGSIVIKNGTIFPHSVNLAATFNTENAQKMGDVTARNGRAAGLFWTFSPMADLLLNPLWGRTFEQHGEDPYLTSQMVANIVHGLQGWPTKLNDSNKIAACMKHFIGYGDPVNGGDKGSTHIPDRQLLNYFVPPFRAAVEAGVATAMESYNDINGEPVASSKFYLQELLRDELRFDGMLVTDWAEINQLSYEHHVAPTIGEAIIMSINQSSIDMSMIATDNSFNLLAAEAVRNGDISEERIAVSAARIVQLKKDLGMFENAYPAPTDSFAYTSFGSVEDEMASLETARESMVLLKNENSSLPLKGKPNILLIGEHCNSLRMQGGGWTVHWQGAFDDSEFWSGKTLLQAIKDSNKAGEVHYVKAFEFPRGSGDSGFTDEVRLANTGVEAAIAAVINNIDHIVACVGEDTYAEVNGNIYDMSLSPVFHQLIGSLPQYNKPITLVLIEGRPRVLDGLDDYASSVIFAGLPGPHGGEAIANVLFGDINPSGRLPLTYPQFATAIKTPYWHPVRESVHYAPKWEFGYGLSYTTFEYSKIELSAQTMTEDQPSITVSVNVRNTGGLAGKDAVLLFVTQKYRIVSPEVRMLKGFKKISLEAQAETTVAFDLTLEQLAFYGLNNEKRWQNGDFIVHIGPIALKNTEAGFVLKLKDEWQCPVCPEVPAASTVAVSSSAGAVASSTGAENSTGPVAPAPGDADTLSTGAAFTSSSSSSAADGECTNCTVAAEPEVELENGIGLAVGLGGGAFLIVFLAVLACCVKSMYSKRVPAPSGSPVTHTYP